MLSVELAELSEAVEGLNLPVCSQPRPSPVPYCQAGYYLQGEVQILSDIRSLYIYDV